MFGELCSFAQQKNEWFKQSTVQQVCRAKLIFQFALLMFTKASQKSKTSVQQPRRVFVCEQRKCGYRFFEFAFCIDCVRTNDFCAYGYTKPTLQGTFQKSLTVKYKNNFTKCNFCDNIIEQLKKTVKPDVEKYPRGRRGAPAKGVVRDNRSEGSNPSFSANSPKMTVFRSFFGQIHLKWGGFFHVLKKI